MRDLLTFVEFSLYELCHQGPLSLMSRTHLNSCETVRRRIRCIWNMHIIPVNMQWCILLLSCISFIRPSIICLPSSTNVRKRTWKGYMPAKDFYSIAQGGTGREIPRGRRRHEIPTPVFSTTKWNAVHSYMCPLWGRFLPCITLVIRAWSGTNSVLSQYTAPELHLWWCQFWWHKIA